ncbi:helix-turn-helix domain-containing protein [Phycicoccus sp. BSK3Z-2]|uniref:Helix-turn-helix domain-containing protein n=1 Tax=Phycicoccus avicenniae TaxID=2828860 RepID=A0A941D7Y9_9MICO|nr:helix-turn-helix domain-containing protein [Phycicoccus avicenniae]MBR7742485.1 helix-turn-helix domain-containing protein [Phycicoccus avicenniae]
MAAAGPHRLLAPAPTPVEPDDELDATVRRAWAALLPQADMIADVITATIFDRDPDWYEAASEALLADVRMSTREHITEGIRTMAGRSDPEHRPPDIWRDTGRRRARQGVPLELVLNSYTLGTRLLWEALVALEPREELGLDDHVLLVAGRRLWHSLQVQNAVLIDAHRRESARLERRDLQRQQGVLDGLVDGRGSDPAFAGDAAQVLGIAADEPLACVVASLDESLDEPLRAPDDRLERAGRMSFWHVRGGVRFGLVPMGGLDEPGLVELLRPAVTGRVGVASTPEGLGGFGSAYQLAVRAVQTLPRGAAEIARVTERLPEVLLSANPDITALLVEQSIGPLLGQPEAHREVLLDTLAALIRCNVSHSRAAEELYCHRNTVIYRQRQIEQLIGRDLRVPRDRLLLALGLMATGRTVNPHGG